MNKYELISGTYLNEDAGEYIAFGIQTETSCIEDVSTDRAFVSRLVYSCNINHVSILHLQDIVLDWIG